MRGDHPALHVLVDICEGAGRHRCVHPVQDSVEPTTVRRHRSQHATRGREVDWWRQAVSAHIEGDQGGPTVSQNQPIPDGGAAALLLDHGAGANVVTLYPGRVPGQESLA